MHTRKILAALAAILGLTGAAAANAQAPTYYTGTIAWMEVWKSGNLAFALNGVTAPCNGQFIVNKSDPGFKNYYAALLAAKLTDRPVRLYFSGCIPAENYGGSYAEVAYMYYD